MDILLNDGVQHKIQPKNFNLSFNNRNIFLFYNFHNMSKIRASLSAFTIGATGDRKKNKKLKSSRAIISRETKEHK